MAAILNSESERKTAAGGQRARLHAQRLRLALVWLVLLAWPLVAPNDYITSLGVMFFINLILVASLNLVLGYAGQISLCHGALFGLGAYISGVLSARYGLTPALGMLIAVAGTAFAALLIALPTLRLRGHYLAMGTLGFNAILSVLFVELVPITGGPNGLSGIAPFRLFGFELDTPTRFYPLAWFAGFLTMFLILNLVSSRNGRALRAVAGSEIAAGALGIDAFRLKVATFAFSAGLAGLAGALYAHFNMFASPETFSFFTSVLLVVMVALGGWGTFWGPFLGALLFTAAPELLRQVHDAELFLFGLCMILVLLYFQNGLIGMFDKLRRRR
ncbi:MAG: branched-chain amino acid ABC transporter permease [Burkholderiales bacterium]|nr:branched-chain amino acid ABC transporter permease [Burkholderiales bacterium]